MDNPTVEKDYGIGGISEWQLRGQQNGEVVFISSFPRQVMPFLLAGGSLRNSTAGKECLDETL